MVSTLLFYLCSPCHKIIKPAGVKKPHHCSHAYSGTCRLTLTPCESLLGSGSKEQSKKMTKALIVSQAVQLQSGAQEAPSSLQRSESLFFKSLCTFFVQCNRWAVHRKASYSFTVQSPFGLSGLADF